MIDQALADEGEIRGLIGWELLFFNQRLAIGSFFVSEVFPSSPKG
jgi:hypothetical protein